jgi:hypothetical protein
MFIAPMHCLYCLCRRADDRAHRGSTLLQELLQLFSGFPRAVEQMITNTPPAAILECPIYIRTWAATCLTCLLWRCTVGTQAGQAGNSASNAP